MKLGHPLVLSLIVTAATGCSGPVDGDDAFTETTSGSPSSGDGPGSTTSGEGGGPSSTTSAPSSSSTQDASSSTSGGDGGNGSGGDASSTGGGAGGGAGTGGSGACEDGPCDDGDGCTEDDTCEDGVCAGSARTCGPPPGPTCADPVTLRTFSGPGVCSDDECAYDEAETPCPSGCAAGACSPTVVTQVSAGGNHTCAVTSGGAAKCWGMNFFGQLGNDDTADSLVPIDVVGHSSGVAAISAGHYHTCALTLDGGVQCWGYNASGQLGDGSLESSSVPVQVTGLSSGVRAISAGEDASCAVLTNGSVRCWGDNQGGALGNGTQTSSSVPVQVTGFASGAVDVSVGYGPVCALRSSGQISCWGVLYDEVGGFVHTVPEAVDNVSGAVTVSAGGAHTCARSDSASGIWCWGNNQFGQLGDDSTTTSTTGVFVEGSTFMSVVSAGLNQTCGIVLGAAVCWGENYSGALGNGTTSDSSVPVGVTGLGSGVVDIEAGFVHTCAVTTAGGVKCWGSNNHGKLGDGTERPSLVPVDVQGL